MRAPRIDHGRVEGDKSAPRLLLVRQSQALQEADRSAGHENRSHLPLTFELRCSILSPAQPPARHCFPGPASSTLAVPRRCGIIEASSVVLMACGSGRWLNFHLLAGSPVGPGGSRGDDKPAGGLPDLRGGGAAGIAPASRAAAALDLPTLPPRPIAAAAADTCPLPPEGSPSAGPAGVAARTRRTGPQQHGHRVPKARQISLNPLCPH